MKVFGWMADKAGCGHLRMIWPMEALAQLFPDEVDVAYDTVISQQWREEADVIVGQRVCNPGPLSLWRRWAREGKKRLVAELDDNLWQVEPENVRAYELFSRPETQDNLDEFIRLSHTVTVSTEPLAEVVRQRTGHTDVRVVPNAVPKHLTESDQPRRHTVGWTGSPTHHNDFAIVERPLRKFLETHPDATFHTIGAPYGHWVELPLSQTYHTPWISDVEKSILAADYRINLAPLSRSVFNEAKSDLRFIQAAARGIPTIASRVPAHTTIRHQVTGVLIRYEHEWSRMIRSLANDTAMQAELGASARDYVRRERTLHNTSSLWLDALKR